MRRGEEDANADRGAGERARVLSRCIAIKVSWNRTVCVGFDGTMIIEQ